MGIGMSTSTSSSGASTSDGVATRASASATTCSRISAKIISWIAPNKTRDSSSVEVFEEVLRRGGSTVGPTLGGYSVGTKVAGVDPPITAAGGIPVTTCRAWVLPEVSTIFCLCIVLPRVFR
ncbi:UNVERIFIED_CONTAM: hypothetical protein Sangu_3054200 [Sesamum angustifolium]|uniref:Uncharacterized protein n=1 Tax=Sesamum angustifolium TaxID=2727405 RepID=A0AAW2KGU2_9LAMI